MDYSVQANYLTSSRRWGILSFTALSLAGILALFSSPFSWLTAAVYPPIVLALAASLAYTPDYLHLTAYPLKRTRWQTRVRWPVLAVSVLLCLLFCRSRTDVAVLSASVAWLAVCNLFATHLLTPWLFPWFFFTTDFALIAFLVLRSDVGWLLAGALLAASAHMVAVVCEKLPFIFAGIVGTAGIALLSLAAHLRHIHPQSAAALAAPLLVSAFATAFLVARAERRNRANLAPVMAGLVEFTGYAPEHIRHLMAISDAELASKWKQAGIAHDDAPRMAQWYQQNSELYLFALVSFNLDYKRIRYFLNILPLARGACLDYGAGNGELLIELARRGHPATYYDVDGLTMKYARHRAKTENLSIQFFSDKQDLARSTPLGFDTIFSLDVLEHLPDLPGELNFLSSLLSRIGSLVFNLPPGSTKSHPMHLDHNLDVRAFLTHRSLLEDTRSHHRRVGAAGKDEMYIFRRA